MRILASIMLILLAGCGGGSSSGAGWQYPGAGADEVPLTPAMTEAIARINARGGGWLIGVDTIKAADREPPHPANWATVTCPGDVVFYRTTFAKPARFFEGLLVHEAYEIQHGCVDHDEAANAMAKCYRSGGAYPDCLAQVEREFKR